MRHSLAFVLSLGLMACQSQPSPHAEISAPPPVARASANAEFGPHRAPVVVRMQGPANVVAGQDITLVAEIEQRVGDRAPVALSLKLPAGVRLLEGSANEVLQPGNGTLERRFVVHVDSVPAEDIELSADTRSPAFGARASSAYRFGRAQPTLAEPARIDRTTVVGGKDLGRPIELKPAPTQ